MNFLKRLLNYVDGVSLLRDWLGANGVPVAQAVAQYRANICNRCPKNSQGNAVTDAIAQAIREQIGLKRHLELHVDDEDKLQTCQVCDCHLPLMVWCPDKLFQNHYTRTDVARYPAECWKRQLIEKTL